MVAGNRRRGSGGAWLWFPDVMFVTWVVAGWWSRRCGWFGTRCRWKRTGCHRQLSGEFDVVTPVGVMAVM